MQNVLYEIRELVVPDVPSTASAQQPHWPHQPHFYPLDPLRLPVVLPETSPRQNPIDCAPLRPIPPDEWPQHPQLVVQPMFKSVAQRIRVVGPQEVLEHLKRREACRTATIRQRQHT